MATLEYYTLSFWYWELNTETLCSICKDGEEPAWWTRFMEVTNHIPGTKKIELVRKYASIEHINGDIDTVFKRKIIFNSEQDLMMFILKEC